MTLGPRGRNVVLDKTFGIPKITKDGKVDFHASRNTYITLVSEAGASWKQTKELARHQSLKMTDDYARVRDDALHDLADSVGETILGNDPIALSGHYPPTKGHAGCAAYVKTAGKTYVVPPEIRDLPNRWPDLSPEVQTAILAVLVLAERR